MLNIKILIANWLMSRSKTNQIYIGKYHRRTSVEDLKYYFKKFGSITECYTISTYAFLVLNSNNTKSFDDRHDAQEAIEQMNGKKIDGCTWVVEPAS